MAEKTVGSLEPTKKARLIPVKDWNRSLGSDEPINDWLHGCEICNHGLINRVDGLQAKGYSQRHAVKILEEEQKNRFGAVLYPAETLRTRIKRNRPARKEIKERPFWDKIYIRLDKVCRTIEKEHFEPQPTTEDIKRFQIVIEDLKRMILGRQKNRRLKC
jgi:hypothetical protein